MENAKDKSFELPFGIDFVVKEDLSSSPGFMMWPASNNSYDINCPFCNGKRKMNINLSKNVARCNKCSGILGYNSVTLHAALTGLSSKDSFKDLMKRWNGLESDAKLSLKNTSFEKKERVTPAPIEIRDKVYREFLKNLSLSSRHKEDLSKRGLSDIQIEKGLYKSIPVMGFHTLAYKAIYESGANQMIEKHKGIGIPGFTDIYDPSKVSCRGRKSGYFIPVIQKDGFISGMQIRYDSLPVDAPKEEKEIYKKYSWYSSSEKETGCSVTGCENIHFAGDFKSISNEINLTEGVLKADIASALSNKPFLGLVGVNNTSQLRKTLSYLENLGKECVNLYIDMDYQIKPEVESALNNIKREINSTGSHQILVQKSEKGFNLYNSSKSEAFLKSYKVRGPEVMPKKVLAFIDKFQIPSNKLCLDNDVLEIETEYFESIRNQEHVLRIVDATTGYENFSSMSDCERKNLLQNTLYCEVFFEKIGLKYKEMNWDDKYKGIDDYYLYLKSKK